MRLHSIFTSMNGEVCHCHQGSLCTFIRFQGCNLKCEWCDTTASLDMNKGREISVEDLDDLFTKDPFIKNITITGGEPLIQTDLQKLISRLNGKGYLVSVETNGSIPMESFKHMCTFVMDIKPPSSGIKDFEEYWEKAVLNAFSLTRRDWVKFPIQDLIDFDRAVSAVRTLRRRTLDPKLSFSPVSPFTPKALLDLMVKENIGDVVLNVQLHKLIGVE